MSRNRGRVPRGVSFEGPGGVTVVVDESNGCCWAYFVNAAGHASGNCWLYNVASARSVKSKGRQPANLKQYMKSNGVQDPGTVRFIGVRWRRLAGGPVAGLTLFGRLIGEVWEGARPGRAFFAAADNSFATAMKSGRTAEGSG